MVKNRKIFISQMYFAPPPHWSDLIGNSHIYGMRTLESLGYHTSLNAWWVVQLCAW